jgi:hypothetical protein
MRPVRRADTAHKAWSKSAEGCDWIADRGVFDHAIRSFVLIMFYFEERAIHASFPFCAQPWGKTWGEPHPPRPVHQATADKQRTFQR